MSIIKHTLCLFKAKLPFGTGLKTECDAGTYSVRASTVCRAWLTAEAANPAQHTHLRLYSEPWVPAEEQDSMIVHTRDTSRMQWELRSTSHLLSLHLSEYNVAIFLAVQPDLSRLESLTLERFGYSIMHTQQLLYLTSLKTLQVQHSPNLICFF